MEPQLTYVYKVLGVKRLDSDIAHDNMSTFVIFNDDAPDAQFHIYYISIYLDFQCKGVRQDGFPLRSAFINGIISRVDVETKSFVAHG